MQVDELKDYSLARATQTVVASEKRIAELENAIAQHKLAQWGGEGVEVSNDADAALYAHVKL